MIYLVIVQFVSISFVIGQKNILNKKKNKYDICKIEHILWPLIFQESKISLKLCRGKIN